MQKCDKRSQPPQSISLINALSEVEPRVVRQLVSTQKMAEWSTLILSSTKEQSESGEAIQYGNDHREPVSPDDYEEWSNESERIVERATQFYEWSGGQEPEALNDLRQLLESVERPADPEDDQAEEPKQPSSVSSSSFWTLEKIFEDPVNCASPVSVTFDSPLTAMRNRVSRCLLSPFTNDLLNRINLLHLVCTPHAPSAW